MKSIGVIRNLDQLGRIVLPVELRKTMDFMEGQAVEIYTEGELIVLKKYQPGCYCCGRIADTTTVLGLNICDKCLNEFAKAKELIDKLR